jgi:hypothetical protein
MVNTTTFVKIGFRMSAYFNGVFWTEKVNHFGTLGVIPRWQSRSPGLSQLAGRFACPSLILRVLSFLPED